MGARELETLRVDTHERGGALPVVGVAPSLAEGAACAELAGGTERAMAAKPEALALWAQGVSSYKLDCEKSGKARSCAKSRCHCERASGCTRRCHRRVIKNSAHNCKEPQRRARASPVGCRDSCRARSSCPFGRDNALRIQEGEGARFRVFE